MFKSIQKNWLEPFFYLGKNPISLIGTGLTSASAITLIGFWVVDLLQHGSLNPYLGIIFFLILPIVFIVGLILMPLGTWLRRRSLLAAGQLPAVYPKIDLGDPIFRHGLDLVLIATAVNIVIVATASYRGASYMDSPQFCGQACHVMKPEYTAYTIAAHSHVACTECHIGSGPSSYVEAKVNGTKQLLEVTFHKYPTPIPSPVRSLRPARDICEGCHTPTKFVGEKLLVKTSYGDDEKNSITRTIVLLHLGGRDSLSNLSGIHGAHLGHIEYIATDKGRQQIPWVKKWNNDGSTTEYVSSDAKGAVQGERRVMDCIDCHNRAAHPFQTPEDVLNHAMADGAISPSLPFVHKKGLELIKAEYSSEAEAAAKIPAQLEAYYRSEYPQVMATNAALVRQASQNLFGIYRQNVFPEMKTTWGTHPNNIGHNAYPGCFRCHDGSHNATNGKSITQDCATCHNLLAVDEPSPKILTDLGIQ